MRVATSVHAVENLKLVPKIDNLLFIYFFPNPTAGSDHQSANGNLSRYYSIPLSVLQVQKGV